MWRDIPVTQTSIVSGIGASLPYFIVRLCSRLWWKQHRHRSYIVTERKERWESYRLLQQKEAIQWRIQPLNWGWGSVLFHFPSRLFFLQSFLPFAPKIRGPRPPGPVPRSATAKENWTTVPLKGECPLGPSHIENKWHMMKNQNFSYSSQR